MYKCIPLLVLFLFAILFSFTQAQEVERVVDGDTFVLNSGDKVRLVGVDTPESYDPNKPVEYFAEQSTAFLNKLISGKSVQLKYGDERTDKYGRLLCYVWVDDTTFVNLEIIKQGYGMAYLRFPHKWEDIFLQAEIEARRNAIGMWASPRSFTPNEQPTKSTFEKPKIEEKKSTGVTVYITKTGSKYHRGTCGYLRKSKISIDKDEAINKGFGACSKCRP